MSKVNNRKEQDTLINIPVKSFIEVTVLLVVLLIVSVTLTYILPHGEFGVLPDGQTDYLNYIPRDDLGGIPLIKGIFAPFLVFASKDGPALIVLSVFLLVISGAFQVMNDGGGIRALVDSVSSRFRTHRTLLLVMVAFLFYCFGSFLGLFEEMLTMLPIVASLCVCIGYDSFTGFICSILACGFGFAGAVTNPFTVLLASRIIGTDITEHIWYRLVIFVVMFVLFLGFLFLYIRKLEKDPASSLTADHDKMLIQNAAVENDPEQNKGQNTRRLRTGYTLFLSGALILIIAASFISFLRDYTVVIMIAYFLIFGIITGAVTTGSLRNTLRSLLKGIAGTLPTIVFIALAASVKYVFEQGSVLPAIINQVNVFISGRSPVSIALFIYLTVLFLEFFISSSTAKAILVMGFLSVLNTGLSKQLLVLLYTFGDGYTNVLFPTSPVLLISLSMIGVNYSTWVRKSVPLFAVNFLLVIAFIITAVLLGY